MTAAPTLSRLAVWCYYGLPLALWITFAFALSTALGDYEQSIGVFYAVLTLFAPEADAPPLHTIYGIIALSRRGAAVLVYAGLVLLVFRALQAGRSHLRRGTFAAGCGIGFAVAGADNAVRFLSPRRHGGWDDFLTEAITVLLTASAAALFFAAKAWERGPAPAPEEATAP